MVLYVWSTGVNKWAWSSQCLNIIILVFIFCNSDLLLVTYWYCTTLFTRWLWFEERTRSWYGMEENLCTILLLSRLYKSCQCIICISSLWGKLTLFNIKLISHLQETCSHKFTPKEVVEVPYHLATSWCWTFWCTERSSLMSPKERPGLWSCHKHV